MSLQGRDEHDMLSEQKETQQLDWRDVGRPTKGGMRVLVDLTEVCSGVSVQFGSRGCFEQWDPMITMSFPEVYSGFTVTVVRQAGRLWQTLGTDDSSGVSGTKSIWIWGDAWCQDLLGFRSQFQA